MTVLSAARELRSLAAELAPIDLWHPAWLSFVGGTALLEGLASLAPKAIEEDCYAAYLSANGGPRSDTFMARDHVASGDPAERVVRAVLRAYSASRALERLDGRLPGQPLSCTLAVDGGWLHRLAVASSRTAALVTPAGVFLADLTAPVTAVAHALGSVFAGARAGRSPLTRVAPTDRVPLPSSIAVDLSPQPEDAARHLHRRAWTAGGGPWLGVGETRDLELMTTCHLVVDGYGHGWLAGEVMRDLDAGVPNVKELIAAAREGLAGASIPSTTAPPVGDALPLGFAGRLSPAGHLGFARVVYALGRLLDRLAPEPRAHFTPTIQVPVAPGGREDADRRRRRVLFGLLALKKQAGELETFEAFRARLGPLVEREAAARGLLSRVLSATATAPIPRALKRRLLATRGEARSFIPPIEVLAGRGQVSLIRYPPDERPPPPLYAVSAPGLVATDRDPFGSFVVTIIDHGETCTVTVGGTGRAGTLAGARELLDELLVEVARVPAATRS